jgi:NAD(P)-dependent dehydrogenase (short-subunit alcohol dehydrogenase family)
MRQNPKITDWAGKRVWLVGASTGIGAALAQALSRRGARLALSARRPDTLQSLAIPDALLLTCDVTDTNTLARARDQLLANWGGVDLVVYLAGDYVPMGVDDFDLASAERVIETNFTGALRLVGTVLPQFNPPHPGSSAGGIALVASIAGYRGLPRALCYGPGKAALIHLAECLHLDLAPRGIGVWVINPGFVATRLTAKNDFRMPALITPEQAAAAIIDGFSTGRFETHFPKRFSRLMKCLAHLPYRWSFPLIRRFTGG